MGSEMCIRDRPHTALCAYPHHYYRQPIPLLQAAHTTITGSPRHWRLLASGIVHQHPSSIVHRPRTHARSHTHARIHAQPSSGHARSASSRAPLGPKQPRLAGTGRLVADSTEFTSGPLAAAYRTPSRPGRPHDSAAGRVELQRTERSFRAICWSDVGGGHMDERAPQKRTYERPQDRTAEGPRSI